MERSKCLLSYIQKVKGLYSIPTNTAYLLTIFILAPKSLKYLTRNFKKARCEEGFFSQSYIIKAFVCNRYFDPVIALSISLYKRNILSYCLDTMSVLSLVETLWNFKHRNQAKKYNYYRINILICLACSAFSVYYDIV